MRPIKERIQDLEFQIGLLDKQIQFHDPHIESLETQSNSLTSRLKSLETQRDLLDSKIDAMRYRIEEIESKRNVAQPKLDKNETRTLKRAQLQMKLDNLRETYYSFMQSMGKAPGTEGKDALDLVDE